jgi:N-acetylglucosaminyl-diphospho-decaprenol L-rhamnosyltransferase
MREVRTDLMRSVTKVVVVLVAFRDAISIVNCLRALSRSVPFLEFEVYISENGGSAAMDDLVEAISGPGGPCSGSIERVNTMNSLTITRQYSFYLLSDDASQRSIVHVGEAAKNLGYAGGINAWLRPLLLIPGWEAVWILNPDTEPTPTAMVELSSYSVRFRKGMVAGCLLPHASSSKIQLRGLAWSKLGARAIAIGLNEPRDVASKSADVESRIDSPLGACMYVSRNLIDRIGLMDDNYFLYYEDLEWGYRAKRLNQIGYAHDAVVPHKGGSTIRTSGGRALASPLATYLEFRNRIIFVREHLPRWLLWAILVQGRHIAIYALVGAPYNMVAAWRGLFAGIRGEIGKPNKYIQ